MRSGLGIFLGFGVARGGGGPAPTIATPGAIDAQPIIGEAVLVTEPEVTGADSVVYQWYRGAPTATPIGGATSAGYTGVDADYGLTLYRRTTYTNGAGDTVDDLEAPGVVGKQFRDDFSPYTVGNVTANLVTSVWDRSGGIDLVIVADTDAPSGKAIDWYTNTSQIRNLWRKDWNTFSAAHSGDDYEELFLIKHTTSAARVSLRPHNASGLVWASLGAGFTIRFNTVWAQLPGDDPNEVFGTNLGNLTPGATYWFRKRSVGAKASYKYWSVLVPEPASWNVERTHSVALVNQGPCLGHRVSTPSDKERCLYMSSGHNAPAPYPVGLELPLPSSSDLMTYATGSAATSFAQHDALITYNFASAQQGRYANGDPFIVNTAGVSITSITPASADVSGRQVNGAMVDYGVGGGDYGPTNQGFDSLVPTNGVKYVYYDAALNMDPGKTGSAMTFASGVEGSILKAVSNQAMDPAKYERDRIDFTGVLTVCAVAPPSNALRPGVSAPSKISHWLADDINWSHLRNLTMPASAPSPTSRLQGERWPLMAWRPSNDPSRTIVGVNNHANYGAEIARDAATAILLANNSSDAVLQEKLVLALVTRGIDVYARAIEGGDWNNGGGGTGNGRKLYLAFAAHMLDDAGMAEYCDQTVKGLIWTEDGQLRYISAGDVATYDYVSGDLGMPEWMINPYGSAPTRGLTDTYRNINTQWQVASALALDLIGARSVWANTALFDYADRIMERDFYDGAGINKWALSLSGSNSPPQFHRDMWANYRTAGGMPAIWDWP